MHCDSIYEAICIHLISTADVAHSPQSQFPPFSPLPSLPSPGHCPLPRSTRAGDIKADSYSLINTFFSCKMQIPLTNSLRCCSGLTGKMIQDFSVQIVKQGKCRKGQNNSLKRSRRQNNGIKDSRAFLSVVFTPHISIHMASLLLEIQKMWFGFPIFNEQIHQYVLLADRKQNNVLSGMWTNTLLYYTLLEQISWSQLQSIYCLYRSGW